MAPRGPRALAGYGRLCEGPEHVDRKSAAVYAAVPGDLDGPPGGGTEEWRSSESLFLDQWRNQRQANAHGPGQAAVLRRCVWWGGISIALVFARQRGRRGQLGYRSADDRGRLVAA